MPAVIDPHAQTWPETAKAVREAIKRRGIPFAVAVRELKEGDRYAQVRHSIIAGRPPMLSKRGKKLLAKVDAWLAEHGN